jgi:cytochrome c oxidase cbb3-type subunit IV
VSAAVSSLWPTLSGILTGILILLFAGIVAWAWSGRRRAEFDATARLPLEEDAP